MILHSLYRTGRFLTMTLPLDLSYFLAGILADIHYLAVRRDREAVLGNLRIIKGMGADERELRVLARQVFRNFAKYLVDFLKFAKIDAIYKERRITVVGKERFDEAAALGKGVVILSAHLGNWELGGSIISYLGYPLTAVALTHQDRKVNEFFVSQRMAAGVRAIEIGASLKSAFKVLKKNGFLGLIGDRDFTRNGIPVAFFGRTTLIPRGPAAFAQRFGSPILPVFLIRNNDNSYTFYIEPLIVPKSRQSEEAAIRATTEQCVSVIESYIKKYPSQWFTFRNIWEEYEKRDMRPHTVI